MLTLDLTTTIVKTTYSSYVMVLGSLRETALIVEAGLTGGCLPARVQYDPAVAGIVEIPHLVHRSS
jgi:hypothetical protein